jgi:predicted DCC family thiol-disulfide oxidoreductase YuxK
MKSVEVFYDGDCPLCMREIRMLQRLDRRRQRIEFTNIADKSFDPAAYGTTYADLMAKIQGRTLPDGRWIEGVEVFRQLYKAVGFGPIVWITRLPLLSHLLSLGYHLFAKNRLRLTGRCIDDRCELPSSRATA